MKPKTLIILLADSQGHENLARALHALLYAKQLHQAGLESKLIFDGGGTQWAASLPQHPHLKDLYQELLSLDIIEGVCEFCSKAFNAYDQLQKGPLRFITEDNGHPDIGSKIASGWQVITL